MERRTLQVALLVCTFLLLATTAEVSSFRRSSTSRPPHRRYKPEKPIRVPPYFPGPGCACVTIPCACQELYGYN